MLVSVYKSTERDLHGRKPMLSRAAALCRKDGHLQAGRHLLASSARLGKPPWLRLRLPPGTRQLPA